jgi:hypothetical protein
MKEDNKKHRIGIVDFALVDKGLSHLEALVFQYVQRFEKNKRPCFASIPHIAAELRLPERSIRRYIKRLIELKFIRETVRGRGRYLNTTKAKTAPIAAKLATVIAAKLAHDCGQIGQLPIEVPIKVLPIEDTNTNTDRVNEAAEKFGLKKRF